MKNRERNELVKNSIAENRGMWMREWRKEIEVIGEGEGRGVK